jgi:GH24 family phage-related lysozyme (muramidase)
MYEDLVADQAKEFEGEIPWMYLDSRGNVTCGIGFLVSTIADAVDFYDGVSSVEDIRDDFLRVRNMTPNMKPSYYHEDSSPMISRQTMDTILKNKLYDCSKELQSIFLDFDNFPDAAKAAILDMIYNLGKPKFLVFKKLIQAVKSANWSTAAQECHRIGIPDSRNNWTASRFLSCLGDKP